MGIAIRIWSKEDLSKVMQGDRWLTTLLANVRTFNDSMMLEVAKARMNSKKYYAKWDDNEEMSTFYATDDEMLLKFLNADYVRLPTSVTEVITNFRDVSFPQNTVKTTVQNHGRNQRQPTDM